MRRRIFVLRHCVRSIDNAVKYGLPQFQHADNYTDRPLPTWGVAPKMCTAGGISIMEGSGRDLRALDNLHVGDR